MYATQQLSDSARAWWASSTAFSGHHLSVGFLRHKLKDFLDLEHGNLLASSTLGTTGSQLWHKILNTTGSL
jgi:hypothetical protein